MTRPTTQDADPDALPMESRHGPAADDLVRLPTRRGGGVLRARVTVTDTIRPDTVFVPFPWAGESPADAMTDPVLDLASRMPEFKVWAVAVTPA